jgi:hypothetical protein
MRIRVRLSSLAAFLTITAILATFAGLAGALSSFIALLLPSLFTASIIHLVISWRFFSYHQSFSTDHPQKGETVRYTLYAVNEGPIPLAPGECVFSDPGPSASFGGNLPVPHRPYGSLDFEKDIHCAWRGTYEIGLTSVRFADALGILTFEERLDPRIFYVYPELVRLDAGVERLAHSTGADRPGTAREMEDPSIFECVVPLEAGRSARHIAWKRWAATGVPARIAHGQARTSALRVYLDLWPGEKGSAGKLASEDMAVSVMFSVLRHLAENGIPAIFQTGSNGRPVPVHTTEEFSRLFDLSTGVIFNDSALPLAAFEGDVSTLLVTTRTLDAQSPTTQITGLDLFNLFDGAIRAGSAPHLILCPPPHETGQTQKEADALAELRRLAGDPGLVRVIDCEKDAREIFNALCR